MTHMQQLSVSATWPRWARALPMILALTLCFGYPRAALAGDCYTDCGPGYHVGSCAAEPPPPCECEPPSTVGSDCPCHCCLPNETCAIPPPCPDEECCCVADDDDSCGGDDGCDDGKDCTDDACVDGHCKHTSNCDDGDPCTDDSCGDDGCESTPKDCDDGDACTDDSCDENGNCVNAPKNCDDGDPCTDDVCEDGSCGHSPKLEGASCQDDGNPCTEDVCQAGACVHPNKADGAECPDDGEYCTDDQCQNGSCQHPPASAYRCPDDGDPCTEDTCQEGVCTHTTSPDGTDCGNCSQCWGGACTEDCPYGGCCSDDGACVDTCPEIGNCRVVSCEAGYCSSYFSCDDDDLCTEDVCYQNTCGNFEIGCYDGNACTVDGGCYQGSCQNEQYDDPVCGYRSEAPPAVYYTGMPCDTTTFVAVSYCCCCDRGCIDSAFCNPDYDSPQSDWVLVPVDVEVQCVQWNGGATCVCTQHLGDTDWVWLPPCHCMYVGTM